MSSVIYDLSYIGGRRPREPYVIGFAGFADQGPENLPALFRHPFSARPVCSPLEEFSCASLVFSVLPL